MENGLKGLLESNILNEDTKQALEEAWNKKIDEMRSSIKEEVEGQVREEFSGRLESTKAELVEAMDLMLTDAVKKHAVESVAATKALNEERSRLTHAIREARADYKAKIAQHTKVLESFVLNQLKSEIAELSEDHQAIKEQRVKLAREISEAKAGYDAKLNEHTEKLQKFVMTKLSENLNRIKVQEGELAAAKKLTFSKLREHRAATTEQTAQRINQLESFVLGQMTKELKELNEDRQSLVEAKVRLVAESKSKLDETKKAFIARASKLVESTVDSHLRKEMSQLKEDIKSARENMFGRRLFEAFSAEYLTSYLSEGSEIKKLTTQLSEAQAQLKDAKTVLSEKNQEIVQSDRRVKLAEQQALRVKTMNELLAPLSKEKQNVMKELLDTVKTVSLKEAFNKYLPTVLNENVRSNPGRTVLSEAPMTVNKTVAVTGNRERNLTESARADDSLVVQSRTEISELRRLAGIEE